MSKVSKMTMNEILNNINLILKENDIIYFCDNMEVVEEFIERFVERREDTKNVEKFLLDNEEYFDKEKLILLTIKNYKENLEELRKKLERFKNSYVKPNLKDDFNEFRNINEQIKNMEAGLARAMSLGKGIETIISFYQYDENEKRFRVNVVDSREIIDEKRISSSKFLKRFDEIDKAFKNDEEDELGMEYILQTILLTDLYRVFPTEQFGNDIRTMVIENDLINKGIKTKDEIEGLKTFETCKEYADVLDSVDFQGLLPDLKATLREYAQYVDMDKLLLISAYRFEEALEKGQVNQEVRDNVKRMIQGILKNIKNPTTSISCVLQTKKDDSYESQEVKYSTIDIKKCLSRFTETEYISLKDIEDYRERINNNEGNLLEIPSEYIDIIFGKSDLIELSKLNEENLIYVSKKFNWNGEQITKTLINFGICSNNTLIKLIEENTIDSKQVIELYEKGIISLDVIKKVKYIIDLSCEINFEKLQKYYEFSKEDKDNEEIKSKYKKYLDIYKRILIDKSTKEKFEESSNKLMEQIITNCEEQEYIDAIENYYKEGMLTLSSILDWNDEKIITKLYEDKIINVEDLTSIGQKLGFSYISNMYKELVNREDITYNERIKYIETGFVKEEDVIEIYKKGLITDIDFLALAQKAIIPEEKAQKIIDSRALDERIKAARAKATGWIDGELFFDVSELRKKQSDILGFSLGGNVSHKDKIIIDPNLRQKYIEMLGLYRINVECEEDSPFYNYEFYATPDETGAIGANSVIIAERYYQNKFDEKKFATNNATYFFKYKNFLVLTNLQKRDMMEERENIVFRASHTVANDKKQGNWASCVLMNVLKTITESDLKGLSEKEKRQKLIEIMSQMYLKEERDEIFNLCKEIDSGEHNLLIYDNRYIPIPSSGTGPDFDDDNDER